MERLGGGEQTEAGRWRYVYSSELGSAVEVKVMSVEGELERPSWEALAGQPSLHHCAALRQRSPGQPRAPVFVSAQLWADGRPLGLPVETPARPPSQHWRWAHWLRLPVSFAELSRDTVLLLGLFDVHPDSALPHCLAATALRLFSKRGVFRQGIRDLPLQPFPDLPLTPDQLGHPKPLPSAHDPASDHSLPNMRRLGKLSKKHREGLLPKLDWLDRLTFRHIQMVNEAEKRDRAQLYLILQFPRVELDGEEYSVVYFEKGGAETVWHQPAPSLVKLLDPDIGLGNLTESKHQQLSLGARSLAVDRDLKPNAGARELLDGVLALPSTQPLSEEQQDLVWKFRFYLASNKKALGKFLESVRWGSAAEARQAEWLMAEWAGMDAEDALELLAPEFSPHATSPAVRRYAVSRLRQAPPSQILLYLPQLVQALRYERPRPPRAPLAKDAADQPASPPSSPPSSPPPGDEDSDLAGFLIASAVKDFSIANYLFWYLKVEAESETAATSEEEPREGCWLRVQKRLSKALMQGGAESRRFKAHLDRQTELVATLIRVMKTVAKEGGNRKAKIALLKGELSRDDLPVNLGKLEGLPHPLDPSVRLHSLQVDKTILFKSSLMPAKLSWRTVDDREYPTIFKVGDDMRQDQVILQMVGIMDRILKKQNLDLRLTPYAVLATSLSEGFAQFVDSIPIRDVLHSWNSVQEFLVNYRPSRKGPLGVEEEVMENYVRSTAGYSLISYLLGIGDRHLHNLLLCKDGHMFHIDFGFILGRDPKPMPPLVKLTKEMVDGMGGLGSQGWLQFHRLFYTAFVQLRRDASVLLNLWRLVLGGEAGAGGAGTAAGGPEGSLGAPDLPPERAMAFLHERLHLNLDDDQAAKLCHHIISSSVNAKIPLISDFIHDLMQTV